MKRIVPWGWALLVMSLCVPSMAHADDPACSAVDECEEGDPDCIEGDTDCYEEEEVYDACFDDGFGGEMYLCSDRTNIIRQTRRRRINRRSTSTDGGPKPPDSKVMDPATRDRWIEAQPEEYRDLIRDLAGQINHVTHEEFVDVLYGLVDNLVNSELKDEDTVYVYGGDMGRSQKWVQDLVQAYLDENYPDFGNKIQVVSSGEDMKDVDVIVYMDDAAYSAEQIVKNLGVALVGGVTEVHLIVPFMSPTAIENIDNMIEKTKDNPFVSEATVVHYNEDPKADGKVALIPDGKDIVDAINEGRPDDDKVTKEEMDKVFHESWEQKSLTYFDHKVPDYLSVLSFTKESSVPGMGIGGVTVLEGGVITGVDNQGRPLAGKDDNIPIVPNAGTTPY